MMTYELLTEEGLKIVNIWNKENSDEELLVQYTFNPETAIISAYFPGFDDEKDFIESVHMQFFKNAVRFAVDEEGLEEILKFIFAK